MFQFISRNKVFIIIGIIVIIFIFVAYSYGKYHPNSHVVQEYVDRQLAMEKLKFQKEMDEKIIQINQLNDALILSQQNVSKKQTEINKLKKDIANINLPINLQETKERLIKLGYNPR